MKLLSYLIFSTSLFAYNIPGSSPPKLEGTETLKAVSRGVSVVSGHAKNGIVFVSVEKVVKGQPFGAIDPFEFFFGPQLRGKRQKMPEQRQKGLGSGFFIDLEKGYILTNNHVIDSADEINLKLSNGSTYSGTVVGRDKNTDVAIVQIKDKKFNRDGLVQLSLGDSDKIRVGDFCIALGAPFGLESSVSFGTVSALGRDSLSITELGNFIQTDAAINPGNSGGPLLDVNGEVIGINTAIYSKSGGYNGIGFAIPSKIVRMIATQLINTGKVERGYLGVYMSDIDPELAGELGVPTKEKGVLIRQVSNDSPAGRSGLKDGDVIIRADGKKITGSTHLRSYVGLRKPGSKVKFEVVRKKSRKNITVKLGNYSKVELQNSEGEDQEFTGFGFDLKNVNSKLKREYNFRSNHGAVVVKIYPGSPAQQAGIEEGDVIIQAGDRKVKSAKHFYKMTHGNKRVFIRVEREGQYLFIPLRKM